MPRQNQPRQRADDNKDLAAQFVKCGPLPRRL